MERRGREGEEKGKKRGKEGKEKGNRRKIKRRERAEKGKRREGRGARTIVQYMMQSKIK